MNPMLFCYDRADNRNNRNRRVSSAYSNSLITEQSRFSNLLINTTIGCNSSPPPLLLNFTLRQHIKKYEKEGPEFDKKKTGWFFVDDLMVGYEDTQ